MVFLFPQVKLVNIRNDDIADGNPKLTLGLIWTIILHFQVSSSVSVVFHFIIALILCLWDLSCCFPIWIEMDSALRSFLGTSLSNRHILPFRSKALTQWSNISLLYFELLHGTEHYQGVSVWVTLPLHSQGGGCVSWSAQLVGVLHSQSHSSHSLRAATQKPLVIRLVVLAWPPPTWWWLGFRLHKAEAKHTTCSWFDLYIHRSYTFILHRKKKKSILRKL